jgi:hypothetical protein
MLNPVLVEMQSNERVADLRRARDRPSRVDVDGAAARARRSPLDRAAAHDRRSPVDGAADRAATRDAAPATRPIRRGRVAGPRQAVGWLLVSAGLRLVVPRPGTESIR